MTFLLWSYKKGPGWFFVTCNLLQRTQRRLHQRTPRKLLVRWRSVDWPRWERQKSSSSFAAYSSKASSEVTSESPEGTRDLQYTDKIRFVRFSSHRVSKKKSLSTLTGVDNHLPLPVDSVHLVLVRSAGRSAVMVLLSTFDRSLQRTLKWSRLKNKKCLAMLKKKIDTSDNIFQNSS